MGRDQRRTGSKLGDAVRYQESRRQRALEDAARNRKHRREAALKMARAHQSEVEKVRQVYSRFICRLQSPIADIKWRVVVISSTTLRLPIRIAQEASAQDSMEVEGERASERSAQACTSDNRAIVTGAYIGPPFMMYMACSSAHDHGEQHVSFPRHASPQYTGD